MGDLHPVDGGHRRARASDDGGEARVDFADLAGQRVDQGDALGGLFEHGAEAGLGAGHPSQDLLQLGLGGHQRSGALRHAALQVGRERVNLLLRRFALGDVHMGAHGTHGRPAGSALHHLAAAQDPAIVARRGAHPKLQLVMSRVGELALGGGDDPVALLGMDQSDPGADIRSQVRGGKAQHRRIAGAVIDGPGGEVPIPDPVAGRLHRISETPLARAQGGDQVLQVRALAFQSLPDRLVLGDIPAGDDRPDDGAVRGADGGEVVATHPGLAGVLKAQPVFGPADRLTPQGPRDRPSL